MKGFSHNSIVELQGGREKLAEMWDSYVGRVVTLLPLHHKGVEDEEVSSITCPYSKGH